MNDARRTLYYIYNADRGLLNAVRDSFHKTFAPDSYPCALCALAFGFFTMKPGWRKLRGQIAIEQKELHRDDYRRPFHDLEERLPVIVLRGEDGATEVLVRAEEMEAARNLEELVATTRKALARAGVPMREG
ncbi:hypothetical protein [Erythrobacter sp.]|uniref:hypothetical protein n=1 Tax=Erythrobacter sp. TaxID=1042 RepID=UPI002EAB0FBB|nr:hypothetical protein [Erythrobacter sp.]